MQSSGYGGGVSEFQQFMVDGCAPPLFTISSSPAPPSAAPAATEPLRYHPLLFHHQPHPSPPLPFQPQFTPFTHSIPATTQQLFHQGHQFQLFHHHHLGGLDHDSGQENSSGGEPSFLADAMNFRLGVNESNCGCSDDDNIAMKELSLRLDYINSNNKSKDKESEPSSSPGITNYNTKIKDMVAKAVAPGHNNYKPFSELDAICKPGNSTNCGGTASGSGLTGDDNPLVSALELCAEPSAGDQDAPVVKKSGGKRKRRRREKRELRLAAAFFERLVKQLMDHQESLHRKFLEAMERRESERSTREDAWRRQEAATLAQDGAATAERQAAIVVFLEKLTGEKIHLPAAPNFPKNSSKEIVSTDQAAELSSTSRWPKAEVQALIRVRAGLDARFQEPGLKGPLWEEVSARMAAVGFRRSAKRCKEKWENINKYFRKTKESGKKRPHNSKTCSYFHQLDQLYSSKNPDTDERRNSDLLDGVVVPTDHANFKFEDENEEEEQEQEGESEAVLHLH
ncbi:uncharacterized protein [Typha angustifolia]|uniref:uncharacterized protein n=1 Tax=Typha angustifolia TaxID=59011 RepID=UPI003C2FFE10